MRKTSFVLIFWLLLVVPLTAQNGKQYAEQIQRFERFVEQQMQQDRIPGMSIAFMKDDFVWSEGFGYADLENKSPAKAESAYRLASVTKPMTAVAILQLVENGKIDLDADVQKYVPYFPEKRWPVKVRLLLGHLGGIPHYVNYDEEGHFKYHKDTREAIAVFEDFDLVAQPGTKYNYSSYGFNLLGAVIEGASGQSYADYMHEHVWGPAGMDATRMDDPYELISNRVRGYQMVNGAIKNSEFVDISSRFAAGGTRSTVGDLIKFVAALRDGKLLSQETKDQMWTSMSTSDGHFTGYGMGWGIRPVNGRFHVSHSGGQAETRTQLEYFPLDNFAIAIGCNLEGADVRPYVQELFSLILDTPAAIDIYVDNKTDSAILEAMNDVFNYGLANFSYRGLSPERAQLKDAFSYFNACVDRKMLNENFQESTQKIANGLHPIADRAFVEVGAFMASKLSNDLQEYYTSGPIPFFGQYIKTYKNDNTIPKRLRFSAEFEKTIQAWQEDWRQTWTPRTQNLRISADTDLESLLTTLRETFRGAKVYPNYVDDLGNAIQTAYWQGNAERGFALASFGAELYPQSDVTNTYYGIALLLKGEKEQARAQITKAARIDPSGFAGAGNLNRIAYQMASIGMDDSGLELLKIAVELHPEVANLYDSIGEFYLNQGDIKQSISYYEKALEKDPNFANAQRMLKKIREEHPMANTK